MNATCTERESEVVEGVLRRIAADLSMVTDHELELAGCATEKVAARVAGEGAVHISFKLAFRRAETVRHGCLLMPLPDAIATACHLMMVPDGEVAEKRGLTELDDSLKEALLEVGGFVAGAADTVLRETLKGAVRARFEGCQGVRESVRPAFRCEEGEPLVVCRAQASLPGGPGFELILMLPELE